MRARHILLRTGGERSAEEARQEMQTDPRPHRGRRGLRRRRPRGLRGPGVGAQRRRPRLLRPRPDGAGLRGGGVQRPGRRAGGAGRVAVRRPPAAGHRPPAGGRAAVRRGRGPDPLDARRGPRGGARPRACRRPSPPRSSRPPKDDRVDTLRSLAENDPALFFYEPAPFGRNDAIAGIGRAPAFNEAALTLAKGAVSDPVQVPRGFAVIVAEDVLPPRSPELAEVEPQVRRAVETRQAQGAGAPAAGRRQGRADGRQGLRRPWPPSSA